MTIEPQRLGERYDLGEVLGRGGMAEVHLGQDSRLGRTVAIKTLRADLARDPTFQARFRREAQSAASLNHPSIVAVYDTGEDLVHGVYLPYIVMEYVEGETLRDLMNTGRRLLPERALEITAGVLRALEYSHRMGIVHRDIKPANVMLSGNGDVKVMDFGIARAVADSSSTITQTAAVIGTAQYLSPEQARGATVDARSDLYSTGCLLYELLTGRPPFIGDSPVAVAYQHVREDPVPPSQLDPDISPEIDSIVLKALAKNPDNRYQDAAEMRMDIERALAGQPVAAPTVFMGASPTEAMSTQTMPTTAPEQQRTGRRRWGYVLLALAVLAVFLLAALIGRALFAEANQVTVPDVVGLTEQDATRLLERDGFVVKVEEERAKEERGIVLDQDPAAQTSHDSGGTVTITVSKGPRRTTVPDVVGLSRSEAEQELEAAGLELGEVSREPSAESRGTVLESDPPADSGAKRGDKVDLVVASGENVVPSVFGLTEDDATGTLEGAGFNVDVVHRETSEADSGTVFNQSPGADGVYELGTTVTIYVATAPPAPEPSPPEPSPSEPTPTSSPSPTSTETILPGG